MDNYLLIEINIISYKFNYIRTLHSSPVHYVFLLVLSAYAFKADINHGCSFHWFGFDINNILIDNLSIYL